MLATTPAYKLAIADNVREVSINGTITLSDASTIPVDDTSIIQGSLYVNSQAVSGDDFDVGSVYISECGFSFFYTTEDANIFEGAKISLQFGIKLADDSVEWIPLGIYYVVAAKKRAGNIVELKGYDGLVLFDTDLPTSVHGDTPEDLLIWCTYGLPITFATLSSFFSTVPNGTIELTLPTGTDTIKTRRDLIMWVCQIIGCFAYMNRSGQLEVRKIASVSSRNISKDIRYPGTSISDFIFLATKILMTVDSEEYSTGVDGLLVRLESNPLVTVESVADILVNLLNYIQTISYNPSSLSFNGDPSIELGDLVTVEDSPSGSVIIPVLKSSWRYRGKHTISAPAKNGLSRTAVSQLKKIVASTEALASAAIESARSAEDSVTILNNVLGGHVWVRQGETSNEILIMDSANPLEVVKLWRWNLNGLGYSNDGVGVDDPGRTYPLAITMDGEIVGSFIKANSVAASKLITGTITAASGILADAVITTAKIENLAVTDAKIDNLAVTTAKIANLAVTTAKIDNLAVTNAKIADAAITNAKIDRASIGKLVVATADIADLAVTTAKIGNLAVTAAQIANATITGAKIANATITDANIANATITSAKILSLSASKIAGGTLALGGNGNGDGLFVLSNASGATIVAGNNTGLHVTMLTVPNGTFSHPFEITDSNLANRQIFSATGTRTTEFGYELGWDFLGRYLLFTDTISGASDNGKYIGIYPRDPSIKIGNNLVFHAGLSELSLEHTSSTRTYRLKVGTTNVSFYATTTGARLFDHENNRSILIYDKAANTVTLNGGKTPSWNGHNHTGDDITNFTSIIQCGQENSVATAGYLTTVTFPVAFPVGSTVRVTVTPRSATTAVTTVLNTTGTSNTGFSFRCSVGNTPCDWIAVRVPDAVG